MTPTTIPKLTFPISESLKPLIDEAIHQVIAETHAARAVDGFGRCFDYAIVGARVLGKLLNHPYTAVSGGEIIDCGDDEYVVIFPGRQARRTAENLAQLLSFHCWVEARRIDADGIERQEVVDFTLRHDRVSAQAFGIAFTRQVDKPYMWDWNEEYDREIPAKLKSHPALRERKKGWLWKDTSCTRLLRKCESDHESYYKGLSDKVLTLLADKLEGRVDAATPSVPTFGARKDGVFTRPQELDLPQFTLRPMAAMLSKLRLETTEANSPFVALRA